MDLKLTRPLVFFDLESTGADRNLDRIIQFCFISFHPDGSTDTYAAYVKPLIPVSPAATSVHGITNEQLQDKVSLNYYADAIVNRITAVDLVGFGILQFDVPMLFQELARVGIVWDYTSCNLIDACNIYKRFNPRDLTSAFKQYCNGTFEDAHDAHSDTLATQEVFFAQLEKHCLSLDDAAALARFSNHDRQVVDLSGKFAQDDQGEIIINFSNNKGQKAKDNISFLYWMLDKEFSEDVKIICRKVINEHRANDPVTPLLF